MDAPVRRFEKLTIIGFGKGRDRQGEVEGGS